MNNYVNYDEQYVVLDGSKYTFDDLKKKQLDAVNFNNSVCNIQNMLRYVKLRSLLNKFGECENFDPVVGVRKYGFVKVKGCYMKKENISALSEISDVADDFLFVDGTMTFAVYDIWEG